jgi:hypothetical protein
VKTVELEVQAGDVQPGDRIVAVGPNRWRDLPEVLSVAPYSGGVHASIRWPDGVYHGTLSPNSHTVQRTIPETP